MKGLFGGILGLVNLFGGAILTIMIGGIAWRNGARWARIIAGALFLGGLMGVSVYSVSVPVIPVARDAGTYGENADVTAPLLEELEGDRRSDSFWLGFATFVAVLALEKLRFNLEERVPASLAD